MVADTFFLTFFFQSWLLEKMVKLDDLLQLLNNLMSSTIHNSVQVSKDTFSNIQSCLQYAEEKIEYLELEYQFQRDEIQQKRCDSELVFVQNFLFDLDSHQKSKFNHICKDISGENLAATESHV